ncbi:hypothetical protein CPB84DRAFT_1692087, partial [Gymnopilus junonius]
IQVLRFIAIYGTQFEDDVDELYQRWTEYIFKLGQHKLEKLNVSRDNELFDLIWSIILIHPSLPSPSGFAHWFWPWLKPGIYEDLDFPPRVSLSLSVIWLGEIAKFH